MWSFRAMWSGRPRPEDPDMSSTLRALPFPPDRRDPEVEERVAAAARVLAGEPVADVARRCSLDPGQVQRWADGLAAGGVAGVGGIAVERPARGPWASSVPVEDYLAVVMHELRTPLTAARVGLTVLARDELDAALRQQVSETVLTRLEALDRLCEDVLDTVAVATGASPLEPERLDVVDLVSDTCGRARVAFSRRLPVVVDVDPRRLTQAVTALLSHVARYAAPEDTDVALQVVGGAALLTVRAHGVHLTAVEAAALFEPFGQAARSDGNGLALYVVRTLVVASGGQVGVAGGSPADGPASTVFWLRLPLAP